jgi:hypothetical protein
MASHTNFQGKWNQNRIIGPKGTFKNIDVHHNVWKVERKRSCSDFTLDKNKKSKI